MKLEYGDCMRTTLAQVCNVVCILTVYAPRTSAGFAEKSVGHHGGPFRPFGSWAVATSAHVTEQCFEKAARATRGARCRPPSFESHDI